MTSKQPAEERAEGEVPKSGEFVSGEGGPTGTQGPGMMPGGSEMQGWKRPTTPGMDDGADDIPVEEQAQNLRDRVENQ
jgi:hypothetical protein